MTGSILGITANAYGTSWTIQAQLFGSSFTWYPSAGTSSPFANANATTTFFCYFDRDPTFPAKRAAEYGKPEYFVAYDREGPSVGDYLADGTDTYFICDQAQLTPSKVVKTNATVSFYRPGATPVSDPSSYVDYVEESPGGDGQLLASGWPISLLTGSRGEKAIINALPDGGREPWFAVLCPAIPGVRLRTDDKFVDGNGFRYQISAVELTELGYRMTAELAQG